MEYIEVKRIKQRLWGTVNLDYWRIIGIGEFKGNDYGTINLTNHNVFIPNVDTVFSDVDDCWDYEVTNIPLKVLKEILQFMEEKNV